MCVCTCACTCACACVCVHAYAPRDNKKASKTTASTNTTQPTPPGHNFPKKRTNAPISTGAGKHLVDAKHVEGVHTHADVEVLLANELHKVLVGADTGSLECLGGNLNSQHTHIHTHFNAVE